MPTYTHIFIDLDDTIWDFQQNSKETLTEIYNSTKLNKLFDNFDHFFTSYKIHNLHLWEAYGKGEISKTHLAHERFKRPLQDIGVEDNELITLINNSFIQQLPYKTKLKPFAKELLTLIRQKKYPITLISNGFEEVQYRKIENSQLQSYFDHIVLSEQVGALKPNPKIYQYALELNHCLPKNAIMIGDNYQADCIGANLAGIDAIYLNNYKEDIPSTSHILVIEELNQIPNVLKIGNK